MALLHRLAQFRGAAAECRPSVKVAGPFKAPRIGWTWFPGQPSVGRINLGQGICDLPTPPLVLLYGQCGAAYAPAGFVV